MKFYSPLRYPGGKNKLAKFLASVCIQNNIDGHYIEPYAGGASVALYLLINNYVKEVTINDFDKSIYAFWFSVLNNTEKLCSKIKTCDVSIDEWKRQRKIQLNKGKEDNLLNLGFSTLFLNRTNYSGIIDGGVIGGLNQKGSYKIDCRFNKKDLIERIKLIASFKDKIHLENLDALDLIKKVRKNKNTIFYFDPPYYLMGPSLYMNHYRHEDHKKVSEEIRKIKNAHWIVSYDNVPEIQELYKETKKIDYTFMHTAYKARLGKESIFASQITSIDFKVNPVNIVNTRT